MFKPKQLLFTLNFSITNFLHLLLTRPPLQNCDEHSEPLAGPESSVCGDESRGLGKEVQP